MLFKKTSSLLIVMMSLLCTSKSSAQEEVLEFTHSASHRIDFDAGFTLANNETGALGIFLLDDRQIHAYGVNERFGMFRKIEVVKQKSMFDNILAKRVNGEYFTLFFHSGNYKKISFFEFNFKRNTLTKNELALNLKGQRILTTYQESTNLKIVSLEKKEPIMWVHTINKDYKVASQKFDLSAIELVNTMGKDVQIHGLLGKKWNKVHSIDIINSGLPVSLAESSATYKVYRQENTLLLTIDCNAETTQLVTLNLEDGTVASKNYNKPKVDTGGFKGKTNSFLLGEHLAQIVVGNEALKVAVTNRITGEQVYTNTITKDTQVVNSISTPFVENKSWKDKNKLLSTKQFFRKIQMDEISITMDSNESSHQLTFGSWEKGVASASASSSVMAGIGANFGMAGVVLYLPIYQAVNPEFSSYASFANGKQVKSDIILSREFELEREGLPFSNLYDEMESFVRSDDNLSNIMFTAFQGGGLLSVYNSEFKTIHMHLFK